MEQFGYARAASISEAVKLLNEAGGLSRPLAGGTDLLLLARHEKVCDRVVDITRIPELHAITRRRENGRERVSIGAAATFNEIIDNPTVSETAPLLAQACCQIGAMQVRNMGTIGGNVANAAACADSLPALICLDALAHIATADKEYEQPVSELVLGPNRTCLPAGGLITAFSYIVPPPNSRGAFIKLGRRNAMAISRLTIAALGRLDDGGRVAEVRLTPGSATPKIYRFKTVEDSLIGSIPTREVCQQAGKLAVKEMIRITGYRWSTEFKEPALQSMVARALMLVFGLAQEPNRRLA